MYKNIFCDLSFNSCKDLPWACICTYNLELCDILRLNFIQSDCIMFALSPQPSRDT